MMPGDIPCNAPCSWRWCRWWSDGHCQDNEACERADFDADFDGKHNDNETEGNR